MLFAACHWPSINITCITNMIMPSATVEGYQSPNETAQMAPADTGITVEHSNTTQQRHRRRSHHHTDKQIERTHFFRCIRVNVFICKCIGVFVPSHACGDDRSLCWHALRLLRLVVPAVFITITVMLTLDFLVNADMRHLNEALALYIGVYLLANQTMLSACFCIAWFWNG